MRQKVSKVVMVGKNLSMMFALLTLCACSMFNREQTENVKGESLSVPKAEFTNMTVFFPKSEGSGLVQFQVKVEDTQKNPTLWFAELLTQLAQPKSAEAMPVFPEKIEFYSLFLDKDVLYLDFSNTIQKAVFPTIQMEQLALEAFLSSIKVNFPFVTQVKILAEHEDAESVFGHTYAQQPFSLKDL